MKGGEEGKWREEEKVSKWQRNDGESVWNVRVMKYVGFGSSLTQSKDGRKCCGKR